MTLPLNSTFESSLVAGCHACYSFSSCTDSKVCVGVALFPSHRATWYLQNCWVRIGQQREMRSGNNGSEVWDACGDVVIVTVWQILDKKPEKLSEDELTDINVKLTTMKRWCPRRSGAGVKPHTELLRCSTSLKANRKGHNLPRRILDLYRKLYQKQALFEDPWYVFNKDLNFQCLPHLIVC